MRRPASLAAALAAALACAGCRPAGAPAAATARTTTEPDFDAGIEVAYLTQGVQGRDGAVPLVAGRPGLLRVFLRAMAPGVPAPEVRAALVETSTGAVLRRWRPTSPLRELPTGLFEAARGASWNVLVPAEDVQPGRHVVVEMDPVPGVAPELQLTSLRLPAAGSLDVRAAAPLQVTLVPVVQSGLQPDVDATRTAESWLGLAAAVYPVPGVDVLVGTPLQTDLKLSPGGVGWSELLGDLERKRVADGSTRHYLGAVRLAAATGTVGRGLVGGRSALVADLASHYQRIAAHELGHNLGLLHAPCGTDDLDSLDPTWPLDRDHAGAHTGVSGWDPRDGTVVDPAVAFDLMSYCGGEATTWISDHNFQKALPATTTAGVAVAVAAAAGPEGPAFQAAALAAPGEGRRPCLLVSGRLDGGVVTLDPVHALETAPTLLPAGELRLDLLDAAGGVLASVSFAPQEAPGEEDGAPASAHFVMAVPLSAAALAAVDGLVVWRAGQAVARRSARIAGEAAPSLTRQADGRLLLRWDAAARPEALLRHPGSGEVLGFARGGAALLPAGGAVVRFSDGLRSDPSWRASGLGEAR